MKLVTVDKGSEVDMLAAGLAVEQMKNGGVIGLSTGRTTGGMHAALSKMYAENPFDISGVTFFDVDEVTGIDETNPWACCAKLRHEVLDALNVSDDAFVHFTTSPQDSGLPLDDVHQKLAAKGGVDLLFLGLGENGHLGFNQPGTPFDSRTRLSVMDEGLERRIKEDCGFSDEVKLGGITLGLADIMEARRIVVVVKGDSKSDILAQILEGPLTTDVPASILRKHDDVTFIADSEAISKLTININ